MSLRSTTSSTSFTHALPAHRHPTLYLEDGDIVLSSENENQVTTFFRIDKLYLRRQSMIFQEMFALPMLSTPGEMYDGVPWIRMPDPTEELQDLLLALYDVGYA